MPVSFDEIAVGTQWNRDALAKLWDYATFHALARGVVTPRDTHHIILFVQEEKPNDFTPYADQLENRRLYWEGEKGHGNDRRIAQAADAGNEIHVFYRRLHRSPYTYLGRANLTKFDLLKTSPSRAQFDLLD